MLRKVISNVIMYSLFGCAFGNPVFGQKANNIRAVRLSCSLPMVNPDSTVSPWVTSYDVYYANDLLMYRFEYMFDSVIDGDSKLSEKRYYFFIYQQDSLFGYILDPNPFHMLPDRRAAVDSFLEKQRIENQSLDTALAARPDSLYADKQGGITKMYRFRATKESQCGFTYYLRYCNGPQGIDESLSRKLDTVPNMKLCEIRGVFAKAYYEEYKMTLPEREVIYELKEIPVESPDLVMAYFNKYETLIGRE